MKIEKYIQLVEANKGKDHICKVLKEEGASEGEAVFAIMKGLSLSLNEAKNKVEESGLWEDNKEINNFITEAFIKSKDEK